VFGTITDANIKAFQETHRADILDPWVELGLMRESRPTGFVYKTTLWKINSLVCDGYNEEPNFEGESLDENVDLNLDESREG
jgi:hypothetical protein